MKNQIQAGDAIYVTCPNAGCTSGTGLQIGAALFGIPAVTVTSAVATATPTTIALWVVGCFTINKPSGENWAVGDIIYWSPTNQYGTKTNSSSDLKIGVCITAVTGTTSGNVRLTPG